MFFGQRVRPESDGVNLVDGEVAYVEVVGLILPEYRELRADKISSPGTLDEDGGIHLALVDHAFSCSVKVCCSVKLCCAIKMC